jgi:hypothetical protein
MAEDKNIVVDEGKSSISDLWLKEDYWAIWLGAVILLVGSLIYFNNAPEGLDAKIAKANSIMQEQAEYAPFKTVAYYEAQDSKGKLKATSSSIGKTIKSWTSKPKKWKSNPLDAFYMDQAGADALNAKYKPKYEAAAAKTKAAKMAALTAQEAAAQATFTNAALNDEAISKIATWRKLVRLPKKLKRKLNISLTTCSHPFSDFAS